MKTDSECSKILPTIISGRDPKWYGLSKNGVFVYYYQFDDIINFWELRASSYDKPNCYKSEIDISLYHMKKGQLVFPADFNYTLEIKSKIDSIIRPKLLELRLAPIFSYGVKVIRQILFLVCN